MRRSRIFFVVIISLVLVLAVNLAGNYKYYAAGNGWHYSVGFVLSITALSWLGGTFVVGPLMDKLFGTLLKPTSKLLLLILTLIVYGFLLMLVTMKTVVLIFHTNEQSVYNYINNGVYSSLFSLIIGLIIFGQKLMDQLKKSTEEKEQLQQEMIRSQYEALKSQVNPHFLFNSLNTLTTMIPRQPEMAVRFVEQMSKVFRYSLQNGDEQTIDLAAELKVVESFLFLNEQRFDGKLHVEIALDDAVRQKKVITQSLLMLAENAIKHNEISAQKPLTISIFSEGNYVVMSNTLQRKMIVESSTNVGLANIKKRYELAGRANVIVEEGNNLFTVKIPLL